MAFDKEGEALCDLIAVANRLCLGELVSRLGKILFEEAINLFWANCARDFKRTFDPTIFFFK